MLAVQIGALTVSNLAMLPAVHIALKRELWAEGCVYAATMCASALYHVVVLLQPQDFTQELGTLDALCAYLTLFCMLWYLTSWNPSGTSGKSREELPGFSDDPNFAYILAFMTSYLLRSSGYGIGIVALTFGVAGLRLLHTLYLAGAAEGRGFDLAQMRFTIASLYDPTDVLIASALLACGLVCWKLTDNEAYWIFDSLWHISVMGSVYFATRAKSVEAERRFQAISSSDSASWQ